MKFWEYFEKTVPVVVSERPPRHGDGVKEVIEEIPPHTHEWEFTTKTYASPQKDVLKEKIPESLIEKAALGVTTLLWECITCHNLRKEEVLGSDGNQLEEVLGNVEKLGPQFLEREGGVFVVAKWQQPEPPPAPQHIPLR